MQRLTLRLQSGRKAVNAGLLMPLQTPAQGVVSPLCNQNNPHKHAKGLSPR